jgi:hypothetical protein
MTDTKTDNRAKEQARAQLDSIVEMVKRLEHCQDCDGEDCDLTDEEIYNGINLYYKEGDIATEEDRESYHDEDEARQQIEEDALSVEIRSDWHTPGGDCDYEYMILLCTGGPACRIVGDLNQYNEPESATIEYQDWFTPWERYYETDHEEERALLHYARCYYFGE